MLKRGTTTLQSETRPTLVFAPARNDPWGAGPWDRIKQTNPPGHLWRDEWTALSGPLSDEGGPNPLTLVSPGVQANEYNRDERFYRALFRKLGWKDAEGLAS